MSERPDSAGFEFEQTPFTINTSDVRRYKSVGGWLLLFCVSLTILSPLVTAGTFVISYQQSLPLFAQFPGLMTLLIVDGLMSGCLMAFSMYAGLGLWRIRPGAVHTAKKYLLCFLAYHFVSAFLPFTAGLPAEANAAMMGQVVKDTVRGIIYVAIWYSYLNRSTRVKETYGTSDES